MNRRQFLKAICDMVIELTAMEVERTERYIDIDEGLNACRSEDVEPIEPTDITKIATRLFANCVRGAKTPATQGCLRLYVVR